MHEILIIIQSFISSFDTVGLILIISLTLIGSIVAGMSGYDAPPKLMKQKIAFVV